MSKRSELKSAAQLLYKGCKMMAVAIMMGHIFTRTEQSIELLSVKDECHTHSFLR